MEDEEEASKVEPSQMELWVQVLDLPPRLQSEQVLREVGDYVGTFVTTDEKNLDGNWKDFMRIRVALDIYKPVKRRMKIKKAGGDWRWIHFRYERLPTFCFYCGLIGHAESFCEKRFENHKEGIEMPNGVWLRVMSPTRHTVLSEGVIFF